MINQHVASARSGISLVILNLSGRRVQGGWRCKPVWSNWYFQSCSSFESDSWCNKIFLGEIKPSSDKRNVHCRNTPWVHTHHLKYLCTNNVSTNTIPAFILRACLWMQCLLIAPPRSSAPQPETSFSNSVQSLLPRVTFWIMQVFGADNIACHEPGFNVLNRWVQLLAAGTSQHNTRKVRLIWRMFCLPDLLICCDRTRNAERILPHPPVLFVVGPTLLHFWRTGLDLSWFVQQMCEANSRMQILWTKHCFPTAKFPQQTPRQGQTLVFTRQFRVGENRLAVCGGMFTDSITEPDHWNKSENQSRKGYETSSNCICRLKSMSRYPKQQSLSSTCEGLLAFMNYEQNPLIHPIPQDLREFSLTTVPPKNPVFLNSDTNNARIPETFCVCGTDHRVKLIPICTSAACVSSL